MTRTRVCSSGLIPFVCLIGLGLAFESNAQAFYWAGWPGSRIEQPAIESKQQVIVPAGTVRSFSIPGLPGELDDPAEPFGLNDPRDPTHAPEPATLAVFGLGMGALVWMKAKKKKRPMST